MGLVHIIGIGEMFWYQVRFEPTPAFEEVASLFVRELKLLDDDRLEEWEAIWDEIVSRGVVLVRPDDGTVIDCFTLHLDDERSELRYVEPSELENPPC